MSDPNTSWTRELTRYHWFVLTVAGLGWLFDTMDQQLFVFARVPAMQELLAPSAGVLPESNVVARFSGFATAIFLIGWATGGLAFGMLGDRIGRARTMMWTILIYSVCTGLSALSVGFWDFAFYRFLTGLGVGGEFAVGVSLVAEVMPERARPYALGLLQALSTVGNIAAAVIGMGLGHLEHAGVVPSAWRAMFIVGTLPALLAVVIRRKLREPEHWRSLAGSKELKHKLGSYQELFTQPRWRKNAIVGLLLAFSGVVGLWGIAFFSVDLIRSVLTKNFQAGGIAASEIGKEVNFWAGIAIININAGGFFGIYSYSYVSSHIGRRATFAIAYCLAMASTAMVFLCLENFYQMFWMLPIMGFCQLSLFGGFAVYFPELFPTYLRSTGVSFCYNVGRFVAASGPALLGLLTSEVFADRAEPMRYAGVSMCAVFLLGLVALPFAPETKGRPLPE